MTYRSLIALAAVGTAAASAGEYQTTDGPQATEGLQSMVPGFDASRILFSQSGDMDLDSGELSVTDFSIGSFLCKPIKPADGFYILPEASYKYTKLNFGGATAPMEDEDLNSLSLSAYFLSMREGNPWIFGAWTRAELATDFKTVTSNDLSFDVAGGVAYRFNERFTLGVGAALTNLNGDEHLYPGIGFDWIVNEKLRVGCYGPTAMAAYAHNEYWLFTARFDFAGGVWNIEDNIGASRSIDLSDNRLGLYASRRLTENLWFTVGAGVTIANELNYISPSGNATYYSSDLETAPFGIISLRVKAW